MKIDFKSKSFTMLISLFFAIAFWSFVMADGNTLRIEDIRNVPVYFDGVEELNAKGLVLTKKSKDSGTMRIEGGVNVISYINVNNVSAYVDLSSITEPGEYELHVNTYCNNNSVVVKSFSASNITVVVEKYVEKQVPVEIVYDKEIPDSYWIDAAKTQTERVTVSGGETMVQQVARGTVTVNTDMLINMYEEYPNHVYEASLPVVFVDADNAQLSGLNYQSSIVTIDVLSKKTVKVDVEGAIEGTPASGYMEGEIIQSVKEIDIAGKKDVLEKVTSLSISPISIAGAKENVVSNGTIKAIEGITVIGSDVIKVTVEIKGTNQ